MGRDLLAHQALIDRIRDRLLDAHRLKGRVLLHYLLMPTEIHVLSRLPAGDSPQALARVVASIVARWVREIQAMKGPVFAARYRAFEVRSDDELKQQLRMLAWRPVAAGLCGRPLYYTLSSLRPAVGLGRGKGYEARELLRTFAEAVREARASMLALIRRKPSDAELREWELNHGLALATGTVGPSFRMAREVDGTAATLVAAVGTQGIDGALRLLERWVASRLELPDGDNLSSMAGAAGARARALVAGLAVQAKLCSAASVARYFKRAKSTLSEQMAACRLREEDRRLLATPMEVILEEAARLA